MYFRAKNVELKLKVTIKKVFVNRLDCERLKFGLRVYFLLCFCYFNSETSSLKLFLT